VNLAQPRPAGLAQRHVAINPASEPPNRPRWFQLDEPAFRAQLQQKPKLITWVARTTDITSTCLLGHVPLGQVESPTRGDWSWQITIARNGKTEPIVALKRFPRPQGSQAISSRIFARRAD